MQFSLLAPPCCGWVGPFLPRLGPTLGPSLSGMSLTCFDHLGSSFPLAYLSVDVTGALVPHPPKCMVFGPSFLCTCVSVRRRDRCTRTPPIHVFVSFVLVLCTPLFHVFSSVCFLPYLGQAHYALHKYWLCCPLSLWWSCGPLHVLPSGARGIVLFLCSCWCASLSSWFLLRSSLCLSGPCCFFCCLPSFVVVPFSVLFAFPPPRVVSFGALVQLVPWRAGTSLWVSGCSCDGLVALPSCWECG